MARTKMTTLNALFYDQNNRFMHLNFNKCLLMSGKDTLAP